MALQSQTLRSSNLRSSNNSLVRSNKSGKRRLVGVVLLFLILGAGFIYLVRNRDGGGPGNLGPQAAKADGVTLPPTSSPIASSVVTPAPVPVAAKPEPTVLEMGGKTRKSTPGVTDPANALPAFTSATKPTTTAPATPVVTKSPVLAESAPGGAGSPVVRDPLASPQTAGGPGTSGQPATSPAAAPTSAMPDGSGLPGELAAVQALAERAIAEKRLVDARTQLNKILVDPRVSDRDREGIRKWMTDVNKELVFSANAYPGDPLTQAYTVEKGDTIIKISRKLNTVTESGFIQRVNNVSPSALKVGQTLKVVKGPFHAVVSKSAFRMDIYAGPGVPPNAVGSSGLGAGAEPGWTYIRSFPVGLGDKGITPVGTFAVKDGSKLIDPPWTNPHTGEHFAAKDPKNPIGLRWIGLVGIDEKTKTAQGYGIHATIQPESIGKEMSMGCVRMNEADVEIVYELLMGKVSVVKIVP